MRFDRIRLLGALTVAATAIAFGGAERASAQTVDASGAWAFVVTMDTGGEPTTPSLTLEQDGETLTGHYSSDSLGEADVTGTVDGSTVTISFEADVQGMPVITVTYVGTIDAEGVMTGTVDLLDGLVTGTFTAKHPEGVASRAS